MNPEEVMKDTKTESESVSQNLSVNAKEQEAILSECPEKLPEVVQKLSCEVEEILKAQGVPKEDRDKIKLDLVSKLKEETLYLKDGDLAEGISKTIDGSIKLEKEENEAEQDQKQKEERQRYIQYLRIVHDNANNIANALSAQISASREKSQDNSLTTDEQPRAEYACLTSDEIEERAKWVIS